MNKRLTTKKEDGTYCVRYYDSIHKMPAIRPLRDKDGYCVISNQYFDKLGRLEDIEEKYGCELPILIKSLTEPIYLIFDKDVIGINRPSDNCFRQIVPIGKNRWGIVEYELVRYGNQHHLGQLARPIFPFDEYGKTWALNKEELTNEKKTNDKH